MQTFGLVILTLVGMALTAGLSLALCTLLPTSMLERAAYHGRYSGLGTRDRLHDETAGSSRQAELGALQGQSV
jgi:hypothetical protein